MESAVSRQVEMAEDASEQELVASDCGWPYERRTIADT
jgi:hypothetical protein